MRRPNTALVISESEREDLNTIVRSMPHALVRRAQIVLMSAAGASNRTVARACGVSAPIVSLWRSRYQRDGLAGLHGELRPGRPRKYDDDQVAGMLRTVVRSMPEVATHWTVRSAAAKTGISKSTVGRYFALFGVQPHRSKSFKLSTDDFFVEKVRDIVGRYLNPPDKALVLCVDEKS
jgi:putative transposase